MPDIMDFCVKAAFLAGLNFVENEVKKALFPDYSLEDIDRMIGRPIREQIKAMSGEEKNEIIRKVSQGEVFEIK